MKKYLLVTPTLFLLAGAAILPVEITLARGPNQDLIDPTNTYPFYSQNLAPSRPPSDFETPGGYSPWDYAAPVQPMPMAYDREIIEPRQGRYIPGNRETYFGERGMQMDDYPLMPPMGMHRMMDDYSEYYGNPNFSRNPSWRDDRKGSERHYRNSEKHRYDDSYYGSREDRKSFERDGYKDKDEYKMHGYSKFKNNSAEGKDRNTDPEVGDGESGLWDKDELGGFLLAIGVALGLLLGLFVGSRETIITTIRRKPKT